MSCEEFKYPFLGIGNRITKEDIEVLFEVGRKQQLTPRKVSRGI